jgi:hypothetical protein
MFDVEAAAASLVLDGYKLGKSKSEKQYRAWCLETRLFLNPLNDLGANTIAARDILTLPDLVTPIDTPPSLIGFFNQMKQEFASARWLYYESIRSKGVHFSDREVLLYNTLDYPAYGLAVEKTKMAMRMAYSLLDKIAFFLNDYLALGVKPKRVSFRSIWHTGDNPPTVREEFDKSQNLPLRGLYWLSKDILDEVFQDSTEPDARELYEIRNHLEHKYLKTHDMLIRPSGQPSSGWMIDTLAYSISRTELDAKGLRVLKLARAALMYLSLGVASEEARRAEKRGDGLVAPMPLTTWEDTWKI